MVQGFVQTRSSFYQAEKTRREGAILSMWMEAGLRDTWPEGGLRFAGPRCFLSELVPLHSSNGEHEVKSMPT